MSSNFSAASLEATQNRVKQIVASISEKVNKLGSIVGEQVTAFAQDLNDYMANTIENETVKQAKIDSINDSVNDLMQRLGQI